MSKKLGQLFFIGLNGPELTSDEEKFIIENNIGGVGLYRRNLESPQQIYDLCRKIRELSNQLPDKTPLFVATDMEGGRVATLTEPFTQWPAMRKLSDLDSTSMAFKTGQSIGAELKAVGINMNFAPCADVLTNPNNTVIGDRALGTEPNHVSKMTSALVRGFIKSEIIACAKHFPGHGNVAADSHTELPVDEISKADIEEKLFPSFKKAFRSRLDFVMTAHIKFPAVDADWPVTLSRKFLTDILRDEMRYKNLVIADDLEMDALSKNYDAKEIPLLALNAGVDMLMYCHGTEGYKQAFDVVANASSQKELDMISVNKSIDKILEIKKSRLSGLELPSFEEAQQIIGCDEHKELSTAIAEGRVAAED